MTRQIDFTGNQERDNDTNNNDKYKTWQNFNS